MKNIAVFLGAGASKSDGAPLQKELFRAYMDSTGVLCDQNGSGYRQNPFYEAIRLDLFRFFTDYFHIDLEHPEDGTLFPTFEEALGILEIEGEFAGRESVGKYKDAIIASMALAIEYQLDHKRNEENYQVIDSYHKKLVEALCPSKNYEVNFLSTNYDLLIDNALLSQNQPINYGLGREGEGINLLKLHGSLNWLYCAGCQEIQAKEAAGISVKNLLNFQEHQCTECGSRKTSVIIPPTYFKNFAQYGDTIKNVWEKAYRLLNRADHIIICGYSFPHADIHIKTLLKKAEQNRKGPPLQISVFNGYEGKGSAEMEKEQRRYQRFLRQDTVLNYRGDVPFEAFAQSPERYLK